MGTRCLSYPPMPPILALVFLFIFGICVNSGLYIVLVYSVKHMLIANPITDWVHLVNVFHVMFCLYFN